MSRSTSESSKIALKLMNKYSKATLAFAMASLFDREEYPFNRIQQIATDQMNSVPNIKKDHLEFLANNPEWNNKETA